MEHPKYFIKIETGWKSPLFLNPDIVNYTDIMENICGLHYLHCINGADRRNVPLAY